MINCSQDCILYILLGYERNGYYEQYEKIKQSLWKRETFKKKIENLFLELTLRDNVTPWWLIVHCVSGQSNLLCAAPAR